MNDKFIEELTKRLFENNQSIVPDNIEYIEFCGDYMETVNDIQSQFAHICDTSNKILTKLEYADASTLNVPDIFYIILSTICNLDYIDNLIPENIE